MIGVFILFDIFCLVVIRSIVHLYESLFIWRGKQRSLLLETLRAKTYGSWVEAVKNLDVFMGHEPWKQDPFSEDCNLHLIQRTTKRLRLARKQGNVIEVMRNLSHACRRNHGGSWNESLYSHSYFGTKTVIQKFYQEVSTCLDFVALSDSDFEKRLSFFKSVEQNYGRSALSLSGGASFSYYHLGVLKALFDQGLLPDIITGTSGGSFLAAIICTRTDEELRQQRIFDPNELIKNLTFMSDSWTTRINRLFRLGSLFDASVGFEKCKAITMGPLTFLEAYKKTGRILCIPVVPDEPNTNSPSKLLNYITTPDVVIASAICASCAVPFVLPAGKLICKTESGEFVSYKGSGRLWRDGSIRSDIPELPMLNVSFRIVSQLNPHVAVFFYEMEGSAGCPPPHRAGHGWRGGFLASSLIHHLDLDLKKWLNLAKDLRLIPPIANTDVSSLFLQQFKGSVTILPSTKNVLQDLVHILHDPSLERLEDYIMQGQLQTWPKMGIISNLMGIEKKLKYYRHTLSKQRRKSSGSGSYDTFRTGDSADLADDSEEIDLVNL